MKKRRKYWAIRCRSDGYLGVLRTERDSIDFVNSMGPMGAYKDGDVVPVVPIVVTPEVTRMLVRTIAANIRQWIDCGDNARELSECAARHVMKGLGIPIGGRK